MTPQFEYPFNPLHNPKSDRGTMLALQRGAAVAAAVVARRRAGGISSLLWRPPAVAAAAAQCQRRQRRGLGSMMQEPLLISSLIQHADRHHPDAEIVSRRPEDGAIHRYTYRWVARQSVCRSVCRARGIVSTDSDVTFFIPMPP